MEISFGRALWRNFLGQSPDWYKLILLVFLVVNPLIFSVNPFSAGWLLVAEFIFTLAMALKCYPLLPGGLLAFEAVVIGMTPAADIYGGRDLLYETAAAVYLHSPVAQHSV